MSDPGFVLEVSVKKIIASPKSAVITTIQDVCGKTKRLIEIL